MMRNSVKVSLIAVFVMLALAVSVSAIPQAVTVADEIEYDSFVPMAALAEEIKGTCGENVTWKLENGILTVSGEGEIDDAETWIDSPWQAYKNDITAIVIEEGITRVGAFTFNSCSKVVSVSLPDTLESIGRHAFSSLAITEITLPENLKIIEIDAFSGNSLLKSVTVPDSVISLGESVFNSCKSLEKAVLGENCSISRLLFYNCYSLKSVEVRNDEFSIGSSAFFKCSLLEKVVSSDNIINVGSHAFYGCTSLKEFDFGAALKRIGDNAFGMCENLEKISLPSTVEKIDGQPFWSCNKLRTGQCRDGMYWLLDNDGKYLYLYGEGDMYDWDDENKAPWYEYISTIEKVITLESVSSIGANAFAGCKNLNEARLYSGISKIGVNAFGMCENLEMLTLSKNVTPEDVSLAFEGCDKLKFGKCGNELYWLYTDNGNLFIYGSGEMTDFADKNACGWNEYEPSIIHVRIQDTVESIGNYAFFGCKVLETINMPYALKKTGVQAFEECVAMKKVYIADLEKWCAVDFRTDKPFHKCASSPFYCGADMIIDDKIVENVTLPEEITDFDIAFAGTNIRSIVIPQGVKEIPDNAFEYCNLLRSVTIPNGVERIGKSAFSDCWNITEINLPSTLRIIDGAAFYGCISMEEIEIPASVETLGNQAFNDCISLRRAIIYPNLKSIGTSVFDNCENLIIYGYKDSPIYDYAVANEISFKVIGWSSSADLNGDGKVTVSDASATLKHLAGYETGIDLNNLDINGDGEITISDVSAILKYIAGYEI